MRLHNDCLAILAHHASLLREGEADILSDAAGNEAADLRGPHYTELAARAEAIVRRVRAEVAAA